MYAPIDVFTYEKESNLIVKYHKSKLPINEIDRILNYTDPEKRIKLSNLFFKEEIIGICLRPWKTNIEQISLISALYEISMDTIILLCMESLTLMLYHTKSGSDRVEAFKEHLDLRAQVYQESRLTQGFRLDLQKKGRVFSELKPARSGTIVRGYSVRL